MDLNLAHLQPIFDNVLATIVYNANGNKIDTVIIDGRTIVRAGKVVTADEQAVIREASQIAHDFLNRQLKERKPESRRNVIPVVA